MDDEIKIEVEIPPNENTAPSGEGVSQAVADAAKVVELAERVNDDSEIRAVLERIHDRLDNIEAMIQRTIDRLAETYDNLNASILSLQIAEAQTQNMIEEVTEEVEESVEETPAEKTTETIEIKPESEVPVEIKTEEVKTRKRRWI